MKSDVFRGVHPYIRVYCAFILFTACAAAPSMTVLLLMGAVITALAAVSRAGWKRWMLGAVPCVTLAGSMVLLSLVSGMKFQDIDSGAVSSFVMRCYFAFLLFSALLLSTGSSDIVGAFDFLRVPALFTLLAGFSLRWFHLLSSEGSRMNTARVLRGGSLKRKRAQLRDLTGLSMMLMMRSYFRAERVAAAMECRGYHGRLIRPAVKPITAADLLPFVVTIVLVSVILVFV